MRSGRRIIQHPLLRPGCRRLDFFSSSLSTTTDIRSLSFFTLTTHEHAIKTLQNPSFSSRLLAFFSKQPTSLHFSPSLTPRFLSTTISTEENSSEDDLLYCNPLFLFFFFLSIKHNDAIGFWTSKLILKHVLLKCLIKVPRLFSFFFFLSWCYRWNSWRCWIGWMGRGGGSGAKGIIIIF